METARILEQRSSNPQLKVGDFIQANGKTTQIQTTAFPGGLQLKENNANTARTFATNSSRSQNSGRTFEPISTDRQGSTSRTYEQSPIMEENQTLKETDMRVTEYLFDPNLYLAYIKELEQVITRQKQRETVMQNETAELRRVVSQKQMDLAQLTQEGRREESKKEAMQS